MNRHQRRAHDAQRAAHTKAYIEGVEHLSSSGPMCIHIVSVISLLGPQADPNMFSGFVRFGSSVMKGEHPLCLTCDDGWPSLETPPPHAIALVSTQEFFRDPTKDAIGLFSGICMTCCETQSDLMQCCIDRYRTVWPDLHAADVPIYDAPDGVQ